MKNLITSIFVVILTYSGISQISDNTFLFRWREMGSLVNSSNITERQVNQVLTSNTPSVSVFNASVGLGYFLNEKISLNITSSMVLEMSFRIQMLTEIIAN